MLRLSWISCYFFLFTGAQDSSSSNSTNTTTSDTIVDSPAFPVVEVVVVSIGLALLLIASFKLTSLVRKYNSASAREVCKVRQTVPRTANLFVCYSCHVANVIEREKGIPVRNFSPSPVSSGRRVSLYKITETFYKIEAADESEQPSPDAIGASEKSDEEKEESIEDEVKASVLGDTSQCTVCMDSAADTVMLPCAHGGICYPCAESLVRKHLLTGGAKCIHCRASIDSLVKLSEIHDQVARGVEIEIPKATVFLK